MIIKSEDYLASFPPEVQKRVKARAKKRRAEVWAEFRKDASPLFWLLSWVLPFRWWISLKMGEWQ